MLSKTWDRDPELAIAYGWLPGWRQRAEGDARRIERMARRGRWPAIKRALDVGGDCRPDRVYSARAACACCGSRNTLTEVSVDRGTLIVGTSGCGDCGAC